MPYIIRTLTTEVLTDDVPDRDDYTHVGSRAVATIEEARDAAYGIIENQQLGNGPSYGSEREAMKTALSAHRLPKSGGTIGPLPDGTVIEVEHVRWDWFREQDLGPIVRDINDGGKPYIDAYNARHEPVYPYPADMLRIQEHADRTAGEPR